MYCGAHRHDREPGDAYNCRCVEDHEIPICINVVDSRAKADSYTKAAKKFICILENLKLMVEDQYQ